MYEGYPMGIPNYNVTVMTQGRGSIARVPVSSKRVSNGKSIEYIASSQ